MPTQNDVRQQLSRIVTSEVFSRAERSAKLLNFLVESSLGSGREQASEYLLALKVFNRQESFDPSTDPVVRVETGRLRRRLSSYYETAGQSDPVVIDLPARTYSPTFRRRVLAPKPPPPRRLSLRLLAMVGLIVLGGVALVGVYMHATLPGGEALREPVRVTFDSGLTGFPAISPDGKLLAYSSDRGGRGNLSIWVQTLKTGNAVRLTHGEANDLEPSFSPEGSEIAFRSERDHGGVFAAPVVGGGEPRLVARDGRRPRYSADGASILFWTRDDESGNGQVLVVPSQGGTPRALVPDFADAHHPVWSPTGRFVLFCGARTAQGPVGHDWWIVAASGGPPQQIDAAVVLARFCRRKDGSRSVFRDLPNPAEWTDQGVVFSARQKDGQSLYRIGFREGESRLRTEPVRLTMGAGYDVQPAAAGGRITFLEASMYRNVLSVPAVAGEAQQQADRVTSNLFDSQPSLSADGRWLAFTSELHDNHEVRLKDLVTGQETLLATGAPTAGSPRIAADASSVVYRISEGKKEPLYIVSAKGGEPHKVCDDCGRPTDWSANQRYILFRRSGANHPGEGLMALDLNTRQQFGVANDPEESIHSGSFSIDGKKVAFHTRPKGKAAQLYVAPFHEGHVATRVAWIPVGSGFSPVWAPDGRKLYFISERDGSRCIWSQELTPGSSRPAGEAVAVHHFHGAGSSLLLTSGGSPSHAGLSLAAGKLVFAMERLSGNIWMLDNPEVAR